MTSHSDMQEFYDRWSHQDPILHLSPSLPDGFLFRSIKNGWFEMAEHATDSETDNAVVGQRILVREIRKTDTIVQYGSEKTEKGWTRHIVAFRQGEESPFALPAIAVPTSATATSATAFASATSFASSFASATAFANANATAST
jgi:hypothetical protein